MTVRAFRQMNKQAGYIVRQFGLRILIIFILMALVWLTFQTFYPHDQPEKPVTVPQVEKQTQLPSKPVEGEVKGILPKAVVEPSPKPLNLNIAPVEPANNVGPVQVDDVTKSITKPNHQESATESPASPVELNYGYKGRDKQGIHLELGASEKSTQLKLGVQVDESKVNVNSIEIEVPLSR